MCLGGGQTVCLGGAEASSSGAVLSCVVSLIRRLFGGSETRRELEELKAEVEEIRNQVDGLEDAVKDNTDAVSVNAEDITDLRHRMHDLEPVAVDLTDREREVLDVLVDSTGFVGVGDVEDELDTSYENAGVLLRNVRDKIDLEVETGPNNKKTYKLTESTESELFGQR